MDNNEPARHSAYSRWRRQSLLRGFGKVVLQYFFGKSSFKKKIHGLCTVCQKSLCPFYIIKTCTNLLVKQGKRGAKKYLKKLL